MYFCAGMIMNFNHKKMKELEEFIKEKFGIDDEKTFLEILENSSSAQGYILGATGEQIFKRHVEEYGYEIYRIKEKPSGGNNAKKDEARGDFYIRKKGLEENKWYVIECKSVKSNAEKRTGLTDKSKALKLLENHSVNRAKHTTSIYAKGKKEYDTCQKVWEKSHKNTKFPKFRWNKNNPGPCVPDLTKLWKTKEQIEQWLNTYRKSDFTEKAFATRKAPVRLIQTHMPSSRTDNIGIKSTGPLVSDFNILCVDLFLRTGKHEFVFANSNDLNHQAKSPNHLQQNYTIDILVAKDNYKRHKFAPWYDNIEDCIKKSKPIPRKMDKSQLDDR